MEEHPKLFIDSLGVCDVCVIFPALLDWGLPHGGVIKYVGLRDLKVCVTLLGHVTPFPGLDPGCMIPAFLARKKIHSRPGTSGLDRGGMGQELIPLPSAINILILVLSSPSLCGAGLGGSHWVLESRPSSSNSDNNKVPVLSESP